MYLHILWQSKTIKLRKDDILFMLDNTMSI